MVNICKMLKRNEMTTDYETIVLKQIYYFIIARPDAEKKSNYDLIIDFFRAMHEGDSSDFFIESFKVLGSFRDKTHIGFKSSPEFLQMDKFLEWVLNEIKC